MTGIVLPFIKNPRTPQELVPAIKNQPDGLAVKTAHEYTNRVTLSTLETVIEDHRSMSGPTFVKTLRERVERIKSVME